MSVKGFVLGATRSESAKRQTVPRERTDGAPRVPTQLFVRCPPSAATDRETPSCDQTHVPGRTNWNVACFSIGSDPIEGENKDM